MKISDDWNNNESRTLEMEAEVFHKLQTKFGNRENKTQNWEDVKVVVAQFNHYDEREDDGKDFNKKFTLLNDTLNQAGWEYKAIDNDKSTRNIDLFGKDKYNKGQGATNRDKNLCDKDGKRLKSWEYAGTILPDTECPK